MTDYDVTAINLITVRPGVSVEDFIRFSDEVDRPTCLAQDVVLAFDAYRVEPGPHAWAADVVELFRVSSWEAWEQIRDHAPELAPVRSGFDRLVDSSCVKTLFVNPLPSWKLLASIITPLSQQGQQPSSPLHQNFANAA